MACGLCPLHLDNGNVTNTDLGMTEVLNDYFTSVFTAEDTHEIHEIIPAQSNSTPLSDCDFTENGVT